jgi:hypothetical protein
MDACTPEELAERARYRVSRPLTERGPRAYPLVMGKFTGDEVIEYWDDKSFRTHIYSIVQVASTGQNYGKMADGFQGFGTDSQGQLKSEIIDAEVHGRVPTIIKEGIWKLTGAFRSSLAMARNEPEVSFPPITQVGNWGVFDENFIDPAAFKIIVDNRRNEMLRMVDKIDKAVAALQAFKETVFLKTPCLVDQNDTFKEKGRQDAKADIKRKLNPVYEHLNDSIRMLDNVK